MKHIASSLWHAVGTLTLLTMNARDTHVGVGLTAALEEMLMRNALPLKCERNKEERI